MKIDNSIKLFIETYDEEAIKSIDELSNRKVVSETQKVKLFNIQECFDKFTEFMEGYVSYKIENISNDNATPQEKICVQTTNFINNIIKDTEVFYKESNNFVKSYLEGVQKLENSIDKWKTPMFEANIDTESIGNINVFIDEFIEKVDSSMKPCMDTLLRSSGYTTRKNLFNISIPEPKPSVIFF